MRPVASRTALAVVTGLVLATIPVNPASAGTRVFSDTVDAAGVSWKAHTFEVQAPATIAATLDWTTTSANLNLFLYSPSGTQVALAASATTRPETITYSADVSGMWRLGVKAKSGSSSYTLSVDGAVTGQPAYLTLLFGRTQWVAAASCTPVPGSVTLEQVAQELHTRGLSATGNVVVDRTLESGFFCEKGYALHPSWEQLATFRDTYGWTFISAGATYSLMTNLNRQQQIAESCGSLDAFRSHGHDRAWGLFAYPGNAYSNQIQADVVSTCFAYGRTYAGKVNAKSALQAPWFQNTYSVNGGACNDPNMNCYSTSWVGVNRRYVPPGDLLKRIAPGAGQWGAVQFYRFATGSRLTGGQRWDCTSANPAQHWTNKAETYCWNDFLTYLNGIPSGTVVTDPATVAEAWGRTLS